MCQACLDQIELIAHPTATTMFMTLECVEGREARIACFADCAGAFAPREGVPPTFVAGMVDQVSIFTAPVVTSLASLEFSKMFNGGIPVEYDAFVTLGTKAFDRALELQNNAEA